MNKKRNRHSQGILNDARDSEKELEILINGLYAAARTDYDGTVCFESSVLEAVVAAVYPAMWAELEHRYKTEAAG